MNHPRVFFSLFCLTILAPWHTLAQTVFITDLFTGEPIEMATLMSESPRAFATTNAQGEAEISLFKGATLIEIRSLGYQTEMVCYDDLQSAAGLALSASNLTLGDVVISATRWNQASTDALSKIITISQKKALLQNPQTTADLLGISGKVFIQKSQQGGGSPMIRGFATNRLLYSVDGIRMNTAIFRSGNIQNVISLDPLAMEHTEVLFGPGSIMYGSDAIGGVMDFQTLTPQLSLKEETLITGRVITRYATANKEKTGHVDFRVGWQKWALATSISTYDYGDLRMGSHGPDEYLRPYYVEKVDDVDVVITNDDPKIQRPSGYGQINLMQKLRFKPNDKWDLQYGFHYSETTDYARYDRHIYTKSGKPAYGEWSYGPQTWMMNNLSATLSANNAPFDQMTLRLAYQRFEESRFTRGFNKPNREIRTEQVGAGSVNLDFLKAKGTKTKLFYGLEGVYNDVASSGTNEHISTGTAVPASSRYPQATWESYGAYLTYQQKLLNKLLLQGGLRYNLFRLDAAFDTSLQPLPFTTANLVKDAITGSIGLVYKPSSKWVLSINCATAFRSPNVDDMGKIFDSEPGSVTLPNPDLEAEYAYNADAGIAGNIGKKVKVSLTAYACQLQNALVRRNFIFNGMDSLLYDGTLSRVQAIQNAAVVHIQGVQADVEVKLTRNVEISSDFNYQFGTEELDDGSISPARHAAPWFGVSRLTYSRKKIGLQLYAEYCGTKKAEDMPEEEKGKAYLYILDQKGLPYAPGWITFNFKAFYQFEEHFMFSAGVTNLTDRRYRPYSSGIAAAGRNVFASLKYAF